MRVLPKIKYVSEKEFSRAMWSVLEDGENIEGLFMTTNVAEDGSVVFVGGDNYRHNDFFVEEFPNFYHCVAWLNREFEMSEYGEWQNENKYC